MSSSSRASFSSRLTEAEKLIQFLNTFNNFSPGDDDLTASAFEAQTSSLRVVQEQHTLKHFDYSNAALIRRKFFEDESNSMAKLLSPIGANIRGKLGYGSQEYHDINTLIKKMRGQRKIKVTEDSKEDTISRCENSFGSRLIYFGDIITLLSSFNYTPINDRIKIDSMQNLLINATKATAIVSQTLALYKPLIASRRDGFKQLSATAKRIKDMVLSQYGQDSTEYSLVKGLVI